MKCCATCVHYRRIDARELLMDPACIYWLCTWTPVQPYWLPAPYLRQGLGSILEAARKPTDGADCPTWSASLVSKP